MGLYEFKPEDAVRFAKEQGIKAFRRGNELRLQLCPYCRNKTNDKDTFAINIQTGAFNCLRATCGMKGNMITLARDFGFSLGRDADVYYQTTDYSRRQYKTFRDAHRQVEVRPAAVEYLESRGISAEVCEEYEITVRKEDDHVLVFPFRDTNGELVFVKYRKTNFDKTKDKNKEWSEAGCKPVLFGMNHCNPEKESGVLVFTEGQIDSLSVAEAGIKNVVSVPNGCKAFTWIPYCYDFVNQFKQIVVFGDCENGSITLSEDLSKRWPRKVRTCQPEDYRGCKDANEILQKFGKRAVLETISNATAPANPYIKPLAKVIRVNIMDMEMFSSGIDALDDVLSGGFRFGQLAILTGKRGEGKSTLASMLSVQALAQGHNVYCYSGELLDFVFRNWMDCQVTGKGTITQSDCDKLNAWYGKKIFVFNNAIIDEEKEETQTLPEIIETAILQNGCRYIMVDNLMTAMTDDLESDLYRAQSKFVGCLAKLAKKYNVFILLICHPRKSNGTLTNDDISGSSNISDRADIVLTFGKKKDSPPGNRVLSVTKNRLTGKLAEGDDAITLVYDPKSRRLASNTTQLFKVRFDWDTDVYSSDQEDDLDEIPF